MPVTARPALGGAATWAFNGPGAHTATDSSGLALFDSGTKPAGTIFHFGFVAAGTYAYRCTIHPVAMQGIVAVPLEIAPSNGGTGTPFTVTWASTTAPAGFEYDVQVLRPRARLRRLAGRARSGAFTPDAGTGTYRFRARLQKTTGGQASGWSEVASIRSPDSRGPNRPAVLCGPKRLRRMP